MVCIFLACVLLASHTAQAVSTRLADSTREVFLDNGMKLLLVQRAGQASMSVGWVAHVGSANERPGVTGISHLFEHMMFKGSPRIGTRDNGLDQQLRNQLDQVREQMFAEQRIYREQVRLGRGESIDDPALQTAEMKALRESFDALLEKQRNNLVKDEFDKIYTEAGATSMNAFTNTDMTVYFVSLPRNKLELWFWMESERLLQPVFREFYSERDVVFEERRMRTDSTPTGANNEVFESLFWRGHAYGWPTVGWPSDIAAITRSQAEDYFDLYYAPGNITLALVGDFDEQQAIDWAGEYFGRIPAGRSAPPDVTTLAMPQLGDLIYSAEVDAPPSVEIRFRTTAFGGDDDPALSVLASVLSGKTGRLYKRLVLEEQIATSAGASSSGRKYDGSFSLSASGKQGVTPEQLRAVLLDELAQLQSDGISDYELQKVRNQLAASQFRSLEDPFYLMVQLLYFDGLREWRSLDHFHAALFEVTADQVQAVATRYLTPFLALIVAACAVPKLPEHPNQLVFSERVLSFPDASNYRHELDGGNVAFMVENHDLPLVRIALYSKAGSYLLKPDQAGLSAMTATMLRDGGTADLSPEQLDERLAFLATGIGFSIGATSSSASLDTLSQNLDESLNLMFDMLVEPRFDAQRLAINRDKLIEGMRRRNDDSRRIEPRVWSELLYGERFFLNHHSTQTTVEAVDVEAMRELVAMAFASGQLIFAISGDIEPERIKADLNRQLSRLPASGPLPAIPDALETAAVGVYGVDKDDVNQTRVALGHPGLRKGHPDEYALAVMNDILGGGGFTSRIVGRVRSDEGLAYSAGSSFSLGRYFPGRFKASFQSKNASVPQALAIILEEIDRIRSAPVSDEEMRIAIESQTAFLADLYSSARDMATRFALDYFNQVDPDYWRNYEANIRKVSVADVQRVARQHLHPDQLRILLVGKLSEAQAGDGEHGTLESVTGRSLQPIRLKDPLSQEFLED
jgi:predicted Zn-dependent peptidase